MADGDLELSRRLQEYAQVMEYAQEVLQILTSPDFLAEGRKAGQKAATIREKMEKGLNTIQKSSQGNRPAHMSNPFMDDMLFLS